MLIYFYSILSLLFVALSSLNISARSFEAVDGSFLLDGKPFKVKAAELHYPRIPQPYWDHRIKMAKALGVNTICLYAFWNVHEPLPGTFDFTGQNDLRKFIELCEENGLYVILRPGPYVCAEWEMGGLPWWLLRDKDIALRSEDPRFLEAVSRFESAVADQISDKTIDKGGPVIMVQVENEYGSFGVNKPYVASIRDMLRNLYGEVTMFQCDWSSNFIDNGLDDLLWTLNFGTGSDIDAQFAPLRKERPATPLMCSEFWSGWFDKWGAEHETRPADDMIANIDELLSKDISFSLYMTHGGTNWGHWGGANSPGFSPMVTSYDYDAPINEQGSPTEKYWRLRETVARYMDEGESQSQVPDRIPTMAIPGFELSEFAPLFANLPDPVCSRCIKGMEELDFGYGSILYRTTLPEIEEGASLIINEPHDYAQVFVAGKLVGVLDRRKGETSLILPETSEGAQLDILVEAMGRINFGQAIKDFKGITSEVALEHGSNKEVLEDWEIFRLPDELGFYQSMTFLPLDSTGTIAGDNNSTSRDRKGVYRGKFNITDIPLTSYGYLPDTFLDFSLWGKGLVYLNGHPLGRIWHIGPQQRLYAPGCWLKEGENEILIFDIAGPVSTLIEGHTSPVLNQLLPDRLQ